MKLIIEYTLLAVSVGLAFAIVWALSKAKKRSAEEQAQLLPSHHSRIGTWIQRLWRLLYIKLFFVLIFEPGSVIQFLSFGFRPPLPVFMAVDFLGYFAVLGLSSAYAHWHLKQILTIKNKRPGMFKLHAIFALSSLFILALCVDAATVLAWKWLPTYFAANP